MTIAKYDNDSIGNNAKFQRHCNPFKITSLIEILIQQTSVVIVIRAMALLLFINIMPSLSLGKA